MNQAMKQTAISEARRGSSAGNLNKQRTTEGRKDAYDAHTAEKPKEINGKSHPWVAK